MADNKTNIIDKLTDDPQLSQLLKDSWEIYNSAQKEIKARGLIIASGQRLFSNPAIVISNDAHKNIFRILKLLKNPNAESAVENWIEKLTSK